MPTVIDSMTGVHIRSDFFDNAPILEFFHAPTAGKHFRAALLYGKNGSGKTTIAQGFREYKDSIAKPTVVLSPSKEGAIIPVVPGTSEKFFVFDEEYVASRVKIEGTGLDAIVLFGEQIDIEAQMTQAQADLAAKRVEVDHQEVDCNRFVEAGDVTSPDYWTSIITNELGSTDGWAKTDSRIKGNVTRSAIPPAIDRIGQLIPKQPREEIQRLFADRFHTFITSGAALTKIPSPVILISIVGNLSDQTRILLAKTVALPKWTDREKSIFALLAGRVEDARVFLVDQHNIICPKCLQQISVSYRTGVLVELENLMNREIDDFKVELRGLLISQPSSNAYEDYHNLRSYCEVRDRLDNYIRVATAHNIAIQAKIDNPFEPVSLDDTIDVIAACDALNQALTSLEADRIIFNRSIDDRGTVARELIDMNDAIAHYAIKDLYDSLRRQRAAKVFAEALLQKRRDELKAIKIHITELDAQRQNFELAVKDINRSLEYIFYCKERLELRLEPDLKYHLKTNGRPVNPKKVSSGERNALALSYFFTEIIKDMNADSGYTDEVLLIIDDPVSSFDFENRIGVLSLLRWKLERVLEDCSTSKILIMTHDINTAFDIEKGLKEISERFERKKEERRIANSSDSSPLEAYALLRLENHRVEPLTNIHKNEYTQLLTRIYEYAKTGGDGLVIGNIMRRVLEAFSTFSYKTSIEDLSSNNVILAILPDTHREYFKNLMYRLVLNGESHLLERVQGMRDYNFSSFLSDSEKKRTAKDILCLMCFLNESHVLAHLPQTAKSDLDAWKNDIA